MGGGSALEVLLSLLEFLCLEVKVDHFMILPTLLSPQISGLSDFKLSHQKVQRKLKGCVQTPSWSCCTHLSRPVGTWALASPLDLSECDSYPLRSLNAAHC